MARRRSRWAAGAVWLALLAVYAAITLDDIRALLRVLPREVKNSYGALVVADALHTAGVSWVSTGAEVRAVRIGVIIAGALLAAALVALRRGKASAELDERRLDAFWAGAAIYIGTYVFSSNFDYRLIFLLLCVPQLCAWHRDGSAPAPWPGAVLGAMLATLWLSSTSPPLLPFGLQSWYLGLPSRQRKRSTGSCSRGFRPHSPQACSGFAAAGSRRDPASSASRSTKTATRPAFRTSSTHTVQS